MRGKRSSGERAAGLSDAALGRKANVRRAQTERAQRRAHTEQAARCTKTRRAWLAALCALACVVCAMALMPGILSRDLAIKPTSGQSAAVHAAPTAEPTPPFTPLAPASVLSEPERTASPLHTTGPNPRSVTLCAAGDTTLGGDVRTPGMDFFTRQLKSIDRDYSWFLSEVRPVFIGADIAMVNLEGPLTTAKKVRKKTYAFKAPPEYVKVLTECGVSMVNLANNHSGDYFSSGLKDTRRTLSDAGIAYCGAGDEAILTRNGVRVGFLGFYDKEAKKLDVTAAIKKLRPKVDVLVVSFHWGREYIKRPDKAQLALGRAAVDAGADLVLGTHSHIIGGVERYKGRYIVYGQGNFCFGGNANPDDKDTFIFRQTLTMEEGELKLGDMEVIPCAISSHKRRNNFQPKPYTAQKDIKRVLKKLRDRSKGLKFAAKIPDAAGA